MCICDYVFLVKTCYYDIIIIIALADKPTNKESESVKKKYINKIYQGMLYTR